MVEIDVTYNGKTRCALVHQSGAETGTVAPKDIGGDGDCFSPTDMVAGALGACILTTMAMWAERNELDLSGMKAHVAKEMRTEPPRRIARLATTVTIPSAQLPEDMRERAEAVARTCPVHKSLHPDVDAPVEFVYE